MGVILVWVVGDGLIGLYGSIAFDDAFGFV